MAIVPKDWKARIQPLPDDAQIKFMIERDGIGETYTKPWWRGHLHALHLIFKGYEVEYIDPPEEIHGV